MTKLFDQAVDTVRSLPAEMQDEFATDDQSGRRGEARPLKLRYTPAALAADLAHSTEAML
jgi:hypothetical protein